MKIHIINPNSTRSMTEKIGEAARKVAGPGTVIVATNPSGTPLSIEGHADEAAAVPPLLAEIVRGTADGATAAHWPSGSSWTPPASPDSRPGR